MNRSALLICMLVLSASLIGAGSFHEVADRYYERKETAPVRCPASVATEAPKTVIGHTETVFLGEEKGLVYDAKVDSGAETSSLHATEVQDFHKTVIENGVPKQLLHVRFTTEDDRGSKRVVERVVSRIDQVRSASGTSVRYFFLETLWIDEKPYEVEINLADRSSLSKKMLVGRNVLNQGYLVDTSAGYLVTRAPVTRP